MKSANTNYNMSKFTSAVIPNSQCRLNRITFHIRYSRVLGKSLFFFLSRIYHTFLRLFASSRIFHDFWLLSSISNSGYFRCCCCSLKRFHRNKYVKYHAKWWHTRSPFGAMNYLCKYVYNNSIAATKHNSNANKHGNAKRADFFSPTFSTGFLVETNSFFWLLCSSLHSHHC